MQIIEFKKLQVKAKKQLNSSILKTLKEKLLYSIGYGLYYLIIFLNEIYFAIEKIFKKRQQYSNFFLSQEESFIKVSTPKHIPIRIKRK